MLIDADKYGTVTVGPEMINDKMLARWYGTAQRFRRLRRNFVTPVTRLMSCAGTVGTVLRHCAQY